jgi:hypothetical protein
MSLFLWSSLHCVWDGCHQQLITSLEEEILSMVFSLRQQIPAKVQYLMTRTFQAEYALISHHANPRGLKAILILYP